MRFLSITAFLVGLGAIASYGCNQRDNPKSSTPLTPSTPSTPISRVVKSPKSFPPITTIYRPAKSDAQTKLPVLITLHGMSSLPKDFLGEEMQEYANDLHAIIIGVSAPLPQNADEYDWSDNVNENHARIQTALDEQLKSIPHRRDRVFLMGYSQGAFAALNLGLTYPEHYSGVIAISPGSVTTPPLTENRSSLKNHGFVLFYGGKDQKSWIKLGQERIKIAGERGAKTEIKENPQVGHTTPEDLDELFPKWFAILVQQADQLSAKE